MEAYKLGLTPDEFWNMIPRDFFKWQKGKIDGLKTDIKIKQQLAGLICATIANFAPNKKSKKYKIEDFIGKEKKQQTEKEMFNQVKRLNLMFGGEVKMIGNS